LFFSTELTVAANIDRVIHLMMDFCDIEQGVATKQLEEMDNLFVYDQLTDVPSIIMEIKRQALVGGVDLVVLDHLQDLSFTDKTDEYETITGAARVMKDLAIELNISILLISQLNRSQRNVANQSRFKGSGKITEIAHVATILTEDESENMRLLQIVKNRGVAGKQTWAGKQFIKFMKNGRIVELEIERKEDDFNF
jgi:replicative DNA helicase